MRGVIIKAKLYGVLLDDIQLGAMLRTIRKSKKLSLEKFATLTHISRNILGAIECGEMPCSPEQLFSIKRALGIEFLPLFEHERSNFMDFLFNFNNEIQEGNFKTAEDLSAKLSVIKYLPDDKELSTLFSIFNCRFVLSTSGVEAAKKLLDDLDKSCESFDSLQRYHYSYVKGTYNLIDRNSDEALNFYLEAYGLSKRFSGKNINLYYNISSSYIGKSNIARSTTFLEEAYDLILSGHTTNLEIYIYNQLGINYIKLGVLQRAKKMLLKALKLARKNYDAVRNDKNKEIIGMILYNFGLLFRKAKNGFKALDLFDMSIPYIDKRSTLYLDVVYQKAQTRIDMDDKVSCIELINEGLQLSKEREDETYTILFKSLDSFKHLNDDTAKYLSEKTLPYLFKINYEFTVLDFTGALRRYYIRRGSGFKDKANQMLNIMHMVQSKIHDGSVIEWENDSFD